MVRERKKRPKKMAVVHCGGGSSLKEGVVLASGMACEALLEAYPEGLRACSYGCLGGGSCVSACKVGALGMTDAGVAAVDPESCVGCGLCVKACPKQLIELVPAENTIAVHCASEAAGAQTRKDCTTGCIACGICEKNCPAGAITVVDHCAVIDEEHCIACGMCAVKCPRGAIVDGNGILTVLAEIR
ncbi:MAG: 4Fe-4S binding protein [Eubacterium aggregans]|uniref:4Fe-4S binding protein n=1 Tax=Eubacterium aggregans TaxID=81409 RepID=UPI0023F0A794|nr:4Fe-4S binding protein [Eubacterium aggregans]MDD4691781.1 4Fe-4S binding protein [Eubacterium aggregans]MEA5072956.1 4Fe-4S binding protein [Eubacterium aggregans]